MLRNDKDDFSQNKEEAAEPSEILRPVTNVQEQLDGDDTGGYFNQSLVLL